jgi:hypothetical protein
LAAVGNRVYHIQKGLLGWLRRNSREHCADTTKLDLNDDSCAGASPLLLRGGHGRRKRIIGVQQLPDVVGNVCVGVSNPTVRGVCVLWRLTVRSLQHARLTRSVETQNHALTAGRRASPLQSPALQYRYSFPRPANGGGRATVTGLAGQQGAKTICRITPWPEHAADTPPCETLPIASTHHHRTLCKNSLTFPVTLAQRCNSASRKVFRSSRAVPPPTTDGWARSTTTAASLLSVGISAHTPDLQARTTDDYVIGCGCVRQRASWHQPTQVLVGFTHT